MGKEKRALVAIVLLLAACGQEAIIDGKRHETCGLIDQFECRDPDVAYRVIVGNVVLSILLLESVIVPIWLIGWHLWEPVPGQTPAYRKPAPTPSKE